MIVEVPLEHVHTPRMRRGFQPVLLEALNSRSRIAAVAIVVLCCPCVIAQEPASPQASRVSFPSDRFFSESGAGGDASATLDLGIPPSDLMSSDSGGSLAADAFSYGAGSGVPPLDWKKLLRPRVTMVGEWEPEVDGVALQSYDLTIRMPTYPFFGPPPPFISGGYSFTAIDSPAALDLPSSLHDFSLGASWMRRINDRWTTCFTVTGAFASDLEHTGSDAWQLRAGGFALYRPNERWSFAFGALATGRDDLPVLPAVGLVWEPSPELRVNLMMPSPCIAVLLADRGDRQHWGYIGGGISGGTWAYERAAGGRDRVSYGEWRLVLGWESTPPRPPGAFFVTGVVMNFEVGYVLGRDFEFDSGAPDISIDGGLLMRSSLRF